MQGSGTRAWRASSASPVRLGAVDSIIQQAIADHNIPGAVLVVGHDGKVIYRKAYGERSLEPRREPMTVDTIFDMASLTKVIATTTAVMQLMELGKVRLNDPVAKYLPEFAQNGKEDITIRQLLTHYSGLAPDIDLTPAFDSKESAFRLACAETPQAGARVGIHLQRHEFHHAGSAGGEAVGGDAGCVYGEACFSAAQDDAYAVSASRRMEAEDCAYAV